MSQKRSGAMAASVAVVSQRSASSRFRVASCPSDNDMNVGRCVEIGVAEPPLDRGLDELGGAFDECLDQPLGVGVGSSQRVEPLLAAMDGCGVGVDSEQLVGHVVAELSRRRDGVERLDQCRVFVEQANALPLSSHRSQETGPATEMLVERTLRCLRLLEHLDNVDGVDARI